MANRAHKICTKKNWSAAVVCGSFMFGGVVGSLFAALTSESTARQLYDYLSDYLSLAGKTNVAIPLGDIMWSHVRWLLFCVLGIFAGLAFLAIPVLVAVRGFLFSFGIACFVRFFGLVGLIPACVLIGIPAFFWIPGLLFVAILGVSDGCAIQRGVTSVEDKAGGWRKIRTCIAVSTLLIVLCVFLEYSLLPALLYGVANFMGYGGVTGG